MHNHQHIKLLFSVAIAMAGFAVASPAQAQNLVVSIMNASTGQCLAPRHHNPFEPGDEIVQQPCNGSTAQQWTIVSGPFGSSKSLNHLINGLSHFCLDARGGAINGTNIEQWPCNQISNENWSFGTADNGNNLLVSRVSGTSTHCIVSAFNGVLQLRACDGSDPNQQWILL